MKTDRPELSDRVDKVKERLSIEGVIGAVVPLKGPDGNRIGLCPFHNEKTGSFHVYGGDEPHYHCFGCGAHGDIIQFLVEHRHLSFLEALLTLEEMAGTADSAPLQPRHAPVLKPSPVRDFKGQKALEARADKERRLADEKADAMRRIWRQCVLGNGTPVEAYLRGRGLDLDVIGGVPPSLRFHPALTHVLELDNGDKIRTQWPAMVAGIQSPDGGIMGLHRTYLSPTLMDGSVTKAPKEQIPVAKKMMGPHLTGAIRLAPLGRDGYPADSIGVGEGIETGLSVLIELVRLNRHLTIWVAGTLGNICGAGDPTKRARKHPLIKGKYIQTEYPDMARPGVILPAGIRHVTILGDGDSEPMMTRAMLNRATRRWQAESRFVRVVMAPRGADFNDLLNYPRTEEEGDEE